MSSIAIKLLNSVEGYEMKTRNIQLIVAGVFLLFLCIAVGTVSANGAPPVASFTASPVLGTSPLTVTFTDTSTNGPTYWCWTFGDGGISNLQNPTHTYVLANPDNPQYYTVALNVSNSYGTNTATQTNYIHVINPFISATASQSYGPIGTSFYITGTDWFGNGLPGINTTYIMVTNNTAHFGGSLDGSLPFNGVNPNDLSIATVSGNPSTFAVVPVYLDRSFSYDWNTGNIAGQLVPGEYDFVIANQTSDISDLFGGQGSYTKIQIGITGPITGIGPITGTPQVGSMLTAGALTPVGATATYQWREEPSLSGPWSLISGAVSNTYTPVPRDVGQYIGVNATGTGLFTGTVASATVGPVTAALPVVTSISPAIGSTLGGTSVTITGSGFTGATAVDFGTIPATDVIVVDDNTITATTPADERGTVFVTVTTSGGTSANSELVLFDYVNAPTVASISPNSGSIGGGTLITITGSGFTGATAVNFGTGDFGNPATSFNVVNDNTITARSPGGSVFLVDVTVTTPIGTSALTAADQFTYLNSPSISSISPTSGPTGTQVSIYGAEPNQVTAVLFGTTPATNFGVIQEDDSGSYILATAPAGTGTVDITLVSSYGTSDTSPADQFTYVSSAPSISTISPTSGTAGTNVQIWGGNLNGVTAVTFGTTPATQFNVLEGDGNYYIQATAPAGTGTVDITVTSPSGTSATSQYDQFTYVATPPVVTSISPNFGPLTGGNSVTITGTGFTGATAVAFEGMAATNLAVSGDTSITATVPANATAGTVDVEVTTPNGVGTGSALYTYINVPQIVSTVQSAESNSGKDTTKESFYSPILEPGSTVITDFAGNTITLPNVPGYLVFVDQHPKANWEHPCEYYYLKANDMSIAGTYPDTSPATNIQFSLNSGMIPNPSGVTSIKTIGTDPTPPNSVATHNYALLISGGINPSDNMGRYYNDIAFMYKTLNQTYHYPRDHITVLLSDGSNSTYDQVLSYGGAPSYIANMGTSPSTFDNGGIDEVNGAATYANVTSYLGALNNKLTSSDSLFIFTTGHGGWDGNEQANKNNNNVWLYLWNSDQITPAQFDNALPTKAGNITVMMEQCYGGGFVGPFISSAGTQTRVIETAANGDQPSNSNYFSYPWISSVNWYDSAGNYINADTSGDGQISMNEAYTFATATDPAATAGVETPQRSASSGSGTPFGVNQFLSAYTATTQSITVTSPTSSTVWTPVAQTITWTQANLPAGTNVVVNLMKKSSSAVQASISGTVPATQGTVSYTVPSSLALGAATDYYVQVSTTGFTPPVMGTSPTFSISGVTTQATGTLAVTSNVTGAQISIVGITDTMSPLPVTPKTFSGVAPLSYLVQLSANGYYPNSASAKVRSGGTTSPSITLSPVVNGDNTPYGEIVVNSNPEGANVFIDGNNIGLTPSDTHIMPGTHKIYVSEDGYQTSAVQSVTIASYSPGLDRTYNLAFTLTPMKTVTTQDLILPNPLNLADTNGYFVAFVLLPKGYLAANVDPTSVYCDGAPATRLVRTKLFPSVFVAIFQRNALVGVSPGNKVTMEVDGVIDKTGGNVLFSGSQVIKVINQKPTSKEDIDKVGQLSDNDVYKNYYPW